MLNLNHLECFLLLAENLSFTETAKQLGVTQPSVSRQIKLLEEELRATLFIRDKHDVRLSPEGNHLRTTLGPLLEEIQKNLTDLRSQSEKVEGLLSLGCLTEVGQRFFAPLMMEFQKQHPGIQLEIRYDEDIHRILDWVRQGTLQFGVINAPLLQENMRTYRLLDERAVLVTRASNPTDLAKATRPEFVGYNRRDPLLSQFLKKFHRITSLPRLSAANSHHSMLELLAQKDAYAVLPFFSVEDSLKKGHLRLASPRELINTLYLVRPEAHHVSRKSELFQSFLLEHCRSISPQLST